MNESAQKINLDADEGPPRDVAPMTEPSKVEATEDFATLYERHYPRVFNYVMRTLMERSTAEDVTSEAFLKAFQRFESFQPDRASFSTWIFRIATNVMRDHFRRNRNVITIHGDDGMLDMLMSKNAQPDNVAQQLQKLEEYQKLHQEICRLRPIYRIVIVLFYFEHKSIREISIILGMFAPTVKWRLHQARRQLAQTLNREGRE